MNEAPPPFPSKSPTQNGLSVASLVLGILSIVPCSIFAGIPAIVTGHIARGRAMKEPEVYGGAGMALSGLIMGYVSIGLAMIMMPAAILLPALAKAKSRAQTISCVNNMKQIGLAARIYANDHNGKFPADFLSMKDELFTTKILVCPGDSTKSKAMDWSQFSVAQNVSYEFLAPGAKEEDVTGQVVFRCPIHGNTGLGDGSVMQGSMPRRR